MHTPVRTASLLSLVAVFVLGCISDPAESEITSLAETKQELPGHDKHPFNKWILALIECHQGIDPSKCTIHLVTREDKGVRYWCNAKNDFVNDVTESTQFAVSCAEGLLRINVGLVRQTNGCTGAVTTQTGLFYHSPTEIKIIDGTQSTTPNILFTWMIWEYLLQPRISPVGDAPIASDHAIALAANAATGVDANALPDETVDVQDVDELDIPADLGGGVCPAPTTTTDSAP